MGSEMCIRDSCSCLFFSVGATGVRVQKGTPCQTDTSTHRTSLFCTTVTPSLRQPESCAVLLLTLRHRSSLTCLDADPTVHSISRSPLPAATGVRGPEGFGSGKFLPGRGYLLWNDQYVSAFHQSRAQNFSSPHNERAQKVFLTKVSDQKLPQNFHFLATFCSHNKRSN